jgi:hypothetical protein
MNRFWNPFYKFRVPRTGSGTFFYKFRVPRNRFWIPFSNFGFVPEPVRRTLQNLGFFWVLETGSKNRFRFLEYILYNTISTGINGAWISGHKIGRAAFAWSSGIPLTYDYWDSTEPNGITTQHCMVLLNKHWHNQICEYKHFFVCEHR